MFEGRTIHLCVTGGIAAYKAAELARRFIKLGAQVQVAMTEHAQSFIGPLTFQSLTHNPVLTKTLDPSEELEIGHIAFAQKADLIVVAPATANSIAKAALGLGDELVSTVLLATDLPVVVAPAMNTTMYMSPAVQRNIQVLRHRGWQIVEPGDGELACGTVGPGRLADYDDIIQCAYTALALRQPLLGRRVLVSAGPTREHLDPVRFFSNPSSGRMGVAVAVEAHKAGATVTLVHGPIAITIPDEINSIGVLSAAEMHKAVTDLAADSDAVFMAAAVADWRPENSSDSKQKKTAGTQSISFVRTRDILAELGLARVGDRPALIGWAAETDDVLPAARKKRTAKRVDMIVANDVSREGCGFEAETNAVTLVTAHEEVELPLQPKVAIARTLVAWLVEYLRTTS
jgi:phosphopantothenoylcysteine decarboxylase/phosphopantothenate--cysteine ligase